jgi:hypothetical protein
MKLHFGIFEGYVVSARCFKSKGGKRGEVAAAAAVLAAHQAETRFPQPHDVARCQWAMAQELRAAISLSRLY